MRRREIGSRQKCGLGSHRVDQAFGVLGAVLDGDDPVGRERSASGRSGSGVAVGQRDRRVHDRERGSGSRRMPLGWLLWMAASRAPTRAPWRIRAASLTWRWVRAGSTVGSATALTSRMIRITTRSSMRVKPVSRASSRRRVGRDGRRLPLLPTRTSQLRLSSHHPEPPIPPVAWRFWLLMSSWAALEQVVAGGIGRVVRRPIRERGECIGAGGRDRRHVLEARVRAGRAVRSEQLQAERQGVVLVGDQRRGCVGAERFHAGVGVEEDAGLPVRAPRDDQELGVERPAIGERRAAVPE